MEKPRVFKAENGNWITRWMEPAYTFSSNEPLMVTAEYVQHKSWFHAIKHANNVARDMRKP